MPGEDFAAQERLMQQLDREGQEQLERVRDMIREAGRPDVLAEMNQRLRKNELGITGARATWHSISDAQRRVLLILIGCNRWLSRSPGTRHFYDAKGEPGALSRVATLRGVRALADRGLLDWEGGAVDPERKAVLTERARFVLKHGRPEPDQHFEGHRS